ncbi:FmdB family zinc ribbon protein [Rhodopila sp.]|uniref:FmdB family zinc ribbon protein n=1 Tax=Rhodopila sp. TaxID=2480087 RepID=UPI003D0E2EA4
MPLYNYECPGCGAFSAFRPLADYDQPLPCPGCASRSPRSLTLPRLSCVGGTERVARETNERSAHAPRSARAHPKGCACCGPSKPAASMAKSFPNARPWMISH